MFFRNFQRGDYSPAQRYIHGEEEETKEDAKEKTSEQEGEKVRLKEEEISVHFCRAERSFWPWPFIFWKNGKVSFR